MSFEYYISEKVYDKDRKLIKEVETDLIEYDVTLNGNLILISWMLWSEGMNDWIEIDLEEIRKKWPSKIEKIEQKIWDLYCDEIVDADFVEVRGATNE